MQRQRQIQIDESLFALMASIILRMDDDADPHIKAAKMGIYDKIDRITSRELYSKYKTAPTLSERETARKAYLAHRAIPEPFQY